MAEGGEETKSKMRLRGTVRWFNGWKGFGFITPDTENQQEDENDVFVHQTSIRYDGFRTLYDGQRVEFELEAAEDGRSRAIDVVPLSRRPRPRSRTEVMECYICGRLGHFARDCFAAAAGDDGARRSSGGSQGRFGRGGRRGGGRRYSGGGGGGRGRGGGGRADCFSCGQEGHFARDCPN